MDGLAADFNSILGIFRSEFRPMMQVGVKANDKQWANGNQYQCCVNTNMPTTACKLVWPVRDCRLTVTLRPPASMMPCARMAPYLAITSSCLFVMTSEYSDRKKVVFGQV